MPGCCLGYKCPALNAPGQDILLSIVVTLRPSVADVTSIERLRDLMTSKKYIPPLRVHLVWANPRTDSLTATITQDLCAQFDELGAQVDELDLYRSGFDSVLRLPDEPDWENPDKRYSQEVHDMANRTMAANALVFVFPVWWYSLPALLKGYIDRVWNYGLFYGGEDSHNIPAVRWIGLAGHSREKFQKRSYDQLMAHHLNIGIAQYCGVHDSKVELLYNTLGENISDFADHINKLRATATDTAAALMASLTPHHEYSV